MTPEFSAWLTETQEKREALIKYGQDGVDPDGKSLDAIKAIKYSDEADRLLCEAEKHLSHEREVAMWSVKKDPKTSELNSREREIIERSAIREAQMIVDACRITKTSCVNRYFAYRGK